MKGRLGGWTAGGLLAVVVAVFASCGSGESQAAKQSAHWASVLKRGCSGHTALVEAPAQIDGATLRLLTACTVQIDGGSLSLTDVTATVGTLAIVLGPKASLAIRDSTLTGSSPDATVTVTSSGNGQNIELVGDHVALGRGILIEVGMGSGATTGVQNLSVTGSHISTDQPRSLGIQFLVRGPATFDHDMFRASGPGSSVIIESMTPGSCTISHVSGYRATACEKLP